VAQLSACGLQEVMDSPRLPSVNVIVLVSQVNNAVHFLYRSSGSSSRSTTVMPTKRYEALPFIH
jgi:hypothetical protein